MRRLANYRVKNLKFIIEGINIFKLFSGILRIILIKNLPLKHREPGKKGPSRCTANKVPIIGFTIYNLSLSLSAPYLLFHNVRSEIL